jgi:AdoMet-dependent rRNA methyltransferase SPB1
VTKVFRSKDYNSLIWVLNFFFDKVEVSKPAASRSSSAEIFIVCLNYKKPTTIDPKFLDPKHVFEDIAIEDEDSSKKINSLKKLLDNKKNRSGYDVDGSGAFYKEANVSEFMKSKDPYRYLSKCHKMVIDEGCKEIYKVVKPPKDLKTIIDDLKVLGRSDLTTLLKFRSKYQRQIDKQRARIKKMLEEEKKEAMTPEEIEIENEEELNKAIETKQKQAMNKERKKNSIQKKSEYLQKMSVMTSINIQNNVR